MFVGGKSALDLLEMIVRCLDAAVEVPVTAAPVPLVDYWVGWILAYCQHETGTPFSRIFQAVPYAEVAAAYYPLHEAPEEKFLEVFGPRIGAGGASGSGGVGGASGASGVGGAGGCTRLARQRRAIGLSQAELADASGVGLRSIQMYEQQNKHINKASAETVLRLSRALHCTMEDVLEL